MPSAERLNVVSARSLTKHFGERVAVDGIDFDVHQGECFGFLGPNGAGKSTVMKMLYGFSPMTSGDLQVLGKDVPTQARSIKARIGVVPQANNLDPDNTVWQNLLIYSRYFRIPKKEAARRAAQALDLFALGDRRDAQIDELSGGMQRRLVMARALLNDPELVLLDEPTTGLDPQARRVVWRTLRRLLGEGRTLVLTTHYLDEAERLCDRVVLIDRGSIIMEGKPQALIAEHAGAVVLEIDWADTPPDPELLVAVDRIGASHVMADGVSTVYGSGMNSVDVAQQEAWLSSVPSAGASSRILRRATLEDVFLRVTGHGLREDAE